MPTIKVNTNKLSSYENEIKYIFSRIRKINSDFSYISRNLDWDIKASSNINSTIYNIENELYRQSNGIKKINIYIYHAILRYNSINLEISSLNNLKFKNNKYITNTTINNSINISKDKNVKTKWAENLAKSTFNIVKEFGTLGSAVSILGNRYLSSNKNDNYNFNKDKGKNGETKWAENLAESTFDIVKEFGVLGSAVSILGNGYLSSNKNDNYNFHKAIIKPAETTISKLGDTVKNVSEGSSLKSILFGNFEKGSAMKELVGKNAKIAKYSNSEIIKSYFLKDFKEYVVKNGQPLSSNFKAITKIGGTLLNLGINAIDNYEEYKKNSNQSVSRAVAETISETAIGTLATIGATAGAAIMLGPAAPAVAVGAVGVGLVTMANLGTEAITSKLWGEENKKNLTEIVSDGILDMGEAAIKKAKEAGKWFADTGKWVAGKAISVRWGSLFN